MPATAWPAGVPPNGIEWKPLTRSNIQASRRSGTEVIHRLPGERWDMALHWYDLLEGEWRTLLGTLLGLNGPAGRIMVPVADWDAPRGGISGTIVATGVADAYTFAFAGVGGTDPVLRAGDLFTVGAAGSQRLHVVTADVNRAGSAATVPCWPTVRGSPAGVAVAFTDLSAPMRLVDDAQLSFTTRPPSLASASAIEFVEPLP